MPQKIYVPSNAADLYDSTELFKYLRANKLVSIHQLNYLTLNDQFHGEIPDGPFPPAYMDLLSYRTDESAVFNKVSSHYLNDYTYWVKDDIPVTLYMRPVEENYGISTLIKESTDTGATEEVTNDIKSNGEGDYKYELGIVDSNVKIIPRLSMVEFYGIGDQERTYGDPNDLKFYRYTPGYPDQKTYIDDNGLLMCTAEEISPCGTYDITVNPDFHFDTLMRLENREAKLTVIPAELQVIGPMLEREYGQPNPEVIFTYSGFKNGDTPEVLTHQPVAILTPTEESPVGKYLIGMGYAEAPNYKIDYIEGYLNIVKASQSIEWDQDFSGARVGEDIVLTATSTSGLKIDYSVSDPEIAIIEDDIIRFLSEGEVEVTASQNGNANYKEAEPLTVSFYVQAPMVSFLSIDPSEIIIDKDHSTRLSVSWQPENAESPELDWISEDVRIARVDEYGMVTGIEYGETIITVSLRSMPEIKASCKVKVDIMNGINGIDQDMRINITVDNGQILVNGTNDLPVNIYAADGTLIYSEVCDRIPLASGLYIVHVGETIKKVRL